LAEVDGSHVGFNDLEAREPSICCPVSQDLAGIRVPFDGRDWLMSEDEVGKQSASSSSK
jgi:hypothetical protein